MRLEYLVEGPDGLVVLVGIVTAGVHRHDVALSEARPLDLAGSQLTMEETATLRAVRDKCHVVLAD